MWFSKNVLKAPTLPVPQQVSPIPCHNTIGRALLWWCSCFFDANTPLQKTNIANKAMTRNWCLICAKHSTKGVMYIKQPYKTSMDWNPVIILIVHFPSLSKMSTSVLDDLGEEVTGILAPVSLCMALTVALVKVLNPSGDSDRENLVVATAYYEEEVYSWPFPQKARISVSRKMIQHQRNSQAQSSTPSSLLFSSLS